LLCVSAPSRKENHAIVLDASRRMFPAVNVQTLLNSYVFLWLGEFFMINLVEPQNLLCKMWSSVMSSVSKTRHASTLSFCLL